MKIIALAVLLAVMQTGPPVPRQTSNANASKDQPVQNDTDANKKPSEQGTTVVQKVHTPPNENTNPSKGTENAEHPVRITELPPVSIMRDWMDCLALSFSAVLLGVGIAGVRAAYRTLKAIETQAEVMINSERAWLTAEVKNFGEPPPNSHLIWIEIPITNNGKTPARITSILVTSKLVSFPDSGWGRPGELPKVPEYDDASRLVTLQGQDIIIAPTASLRHMHVHILPSELERIKTRKESLYVYGSVEYLDTVRQLAHKTCFCSIYWVPEKGFNESEGFMFSQIIPAGYFCAT